MLGKSEDLPRELEAQFVEVIRQVRELADRGQAGFGQRPAEGSWSAAECIDHLNVTARLYLPALGQAIDTAREAGSVGDRRDGRTILGRIITWAMEPPPRLKMATFAELQPQQALEPGALVSDFSELHRGLIDQIHEARDLDRKRIKVRSLLDSRLRLSLDDWYAFLAAHGRRHIWQAEKALERAGPSQLSTQRESE
jgi:hypothetical protein